MALGLDKYYEGDQIKKNEIGRASGRKGEGKFLENFGWKTQGQSSLEIPRRRGMNNIKMDLKEIRRRC